jgi:hypothetical protein
MSVLYTSFYNLFIIFLSTFSVLILKQIKVDLFLGCMMSLSPSPPSENLSSMPEMAESVDFPWQVGVGGGVGWVGVHPRHHQSPNL